MKKSLMEGWIIKLYSKINCGLVPHAHEKSFITSGPYLSNASHWKLLRRLEFISLMPIGLFYLYQMDETIYQLRGVWYHFYLL